MVSDSVLLTRYAKSRDADAFSELAKRYAGLVYGTCLRITGDPDNAEDAAQDSFLELARNAGRINSSLPAWLHQVARSRAINRLRSESTRRRYEKESQAEMSDDREPEWSDIAPYVDEALNGLPDCLKIPLILYYLEGRSQAEVASELRVSQATVSRQLERGISMLRERLKKAGVVVSVAALGTLLLRNRSTTVPSGLTASLGKMAISGIGAAVGKARLPMPAVPIGTLAAALLGTFVGKTIMVTTGLAVLFCGWLVVRPHPQPAWQQPRDEACRRQLQAIRLKLRAYWQQHGRPPRELFDTSKATRFPDWCFCPTTHALYTYNPKRFPGRWVVCTSEKHKEF